MAYMFADCSFMLFSNRKLMLVSPRTSQPMFLPQSFQNGTSVLSVDILYFRIFFSHCYIYYYYEIYNTLVYTTQVNSAFCEH